MKDKRDVLLDFCSNPDAALNALHQAGWQIIPRASHASEALNIARKLKEHYPSAKGVNELIECLESAHASEYGADTKRLQYYCEWAWTIIANAGGGDWKRESKDWQEAAAKWRDEYHAALSQWEAK